MKLSDLSTGLLLLIIGAALWIYVVHPEAFQDALADITQDPQGIRFQLAHDRKLLADTSKTPESAPQAPETPKSLPPPSPSPPPETSSSPASIAPTAYTPPDPLPAQPNWNWTTTDGKVYKNVIIKSAEADCVTILTDDGGARIDMALLPPDLQKLLNYDPVLAQKAREEREKKDALAATTLQKNLQLKHRQMDSANQEGSDLTQQDQAQANINSAEAEADRQGQITIIKGQIADWETTIERMKYNKIHDPQDFNLEKLTEAQETLTTLNSQLDALQKQSTEAAASH